MAQCIGAQLVLHHRNAAFPIKQSAIFLFLAGYKCEYLFVERHNVLYQMQEVKLLSLYAL